MPEHEPAVALLTLQFVKTNALGAPATTVKPMVLEVVALPFTVALAWVVSGPARTPVTVSVMTPATAGTDVVSPLTVPAPEPAVLLKVTLSVASAPLVTGLPAASWMVAGSTRVAPEARFPVGPEGAIWVAVPLRIG